MIGIAGALVDKYSATISWVGGLPPSLPFVVLFVVLIVTPPRLLAQTPPGGPVPGPALLSRAGRVRLSAGVIAVGLLAIVPLFQTTHLAVWSARPDRHHPVPVARPAGAALRTDLAVPAGVRRGGGGGLRPLRGQHGMPWLVALVLAALVAVPVGALIAIPAVRVSGVFLALATLGFGILVEEVFYDRAASCSADHRSASPTLGPTFRSAAGTSRPTRASTICC